MRVKTESKIERRASGENVDGAIWHLREAVSPQWLSQLQKDKAKIADLSQPQLLAERRVIDARRQGCEARVVADYHSYSPVALWKTYSLPLTVSTPSFRMHFLKKVSVT